MICYIAKDMKRDVALRKAVEEYEKFSGSELPRMSKEENGKPYFENGVKVSIAHSNEYMVVAFSSQEVGVDIEKFKNLPYRQTAERFFLPEETTAMKRKSDFFVLWTRKEALIKLHGAGISQMKQYPLYKTGDIKLSTYQFIDKYYLSLASQDQDIIFQILF